MNEARTFKVLNPPMTGGDVSDWERSLNRQMETWEVDYSVPVDGRYDAEDRSLTASVLYGLGFLAPTESMRHGLTPELRIKVRNKRLTEAELRRHRERERHWLPAFRDRHRERMVSPPLARILQDSWGYHPPIHDGIDLISTPRAAGLAICRARVIRADNSGWWKKGAPSPAVAAKGDGIVVIRSLTSTGPFRIGLNFCYGHAENVLVKEGQVVEAGQAICEAGLANAWHFHFMVNDRNDDLGLGDRDPRPFLDYAVKHA